MNKNSSNLISRLIQRRKWLLIVLVLLVSGMMTFTVLAAVLDSATGIDVRGTVPGTNDYYTDTVAVYWSEIRDTSAGTGNFDPFLAFGLNGRQFAYNYDDGDTTLPQPNDSDTDNPQIDKAKTEALLLSSIPLAQLCDETINPTECYFYREIALDLNEEGGNDEITLESLQIFTSTEKNEFWFSPYSADPPLLITETAGTAETVTASLVYDLDADGDIYLILMQQVSGSGKSDYIIALKEDVFGTTSNCDFGNPLCDTWIYLWTVMGRAACSGYPQGDTALFTGTCPSDDGFEEWGRGIYAPLAVTLASFEATAEAPGLNKLEWMTFEETKIVGFNIWRSTDLNGERQKIASLVTPQGSLLPYTFEDTDVQAGVTHYYWLEAVNMDGSFEVFSPAEATWWWKSYIPMITR